MCGKNPLWEHHFLSHIVLKRAHGYSCPFTAKCVSVPWPLRFLGGSPVPGTLVCGCWTVPERGLTLLPSLCSSSTGHSKKPFLPAEHNLLSGAVPGAQLQFSLSWSLPTGWPYNFTAGYSVSWGCTLGLLKGDFGETFEVGFRSSSWGHCQYYFLMAGYDHEDD